MKIEFDKTGSQRLKRLARTKCKVVVVVVVAAAAAAAAAAVVVIVVGGSRDSQDGGRLFFELSKNCCVLSNYIVTNE